jgi:hypothetical protein
MSHRPRLRLLGEANAAVILEGRRERETAHERAAAEANAASASAAEQSLAKEGGAEQGAAGSEPVGVRDGGGAVGEAPPAAQRRPKPKSRAQLAREAAAAAAAAAEAELAPLLTRLNGQLIPGLPAVLAASAAAGVAALGGAAGWARGRGSDADSGGES